jgi:cobalt/nickel transport system permease protein
MAGGHVHALYRHGTSPLHRLAPHVKIVAAVAFVAAVVATPREAVWAFVAYAITLLALATWARLGAGFVARRMLIGVPFIVAAMFLPFLGDAPTTDVLGVSVSVEGLWGLWNIVAKASLGLLTSIVLAGTTQIPEMLRGLTSLRVPHVVTTIIGFMVRYLDVVLGDLRRQRIAMMSRGHTAMWLGQVKPFAQSVGTTFVRSYERGERVYLAMASRGYDGHMPATPRDHAGAGSWAAGLMVPAAAWATALTASIAT